ncbi:MAG: substrate-binding domain-containing protein [bacterium]|nr:substrate-binding domain-containing protein [bacterium]
MFILLITGPYSSRVYSADDSFWAVAAKKVQTASQKSLSWDGPTAGPQAQSGKTIIYFADDLRNGGILAVGEGIREAAGVIGWQIRVVDAQGSEDGRRLAFNRALQLKPDGFILGGADALANVGYLNILHHEGIPIVGWHVGPAPGPVAGTPVLTNVTTENQHVAEIAAYFAAIETGGPVSAVIFTDSRYEIAMSKARAMEHVLERCPVCNVLAFEDVSLAKADQLMPDIVRRLLAAHGNRWTHALGINDLYFDYAAPVLATENIPPTGSISNISAGDGSVSAFQRIRIGSYQNATVAEPLHLQGWQLVDELNRVFAGEPVSAYINPVHLVTRDNIEYDGGLKNRYDPDNGYREAYRAIWFK